MAKIVLLAFGAAFFPALLACVAILISRPEPRRLIFAFYLGGLVTSLVSGVVVLRVFESGGEIAGNSDGSSHAGIAIGVGVVGLFFSWLLVSHRGRALVDRWHDRHPRRWKKEPHEGPSWVERRLNRATVRIAFVVGAAINLPGPFYLVALGDLSSGFNTAEQVIGILVFNAIMFVLLEAPLVGYIVNPTWTELAVARLGAWLNANGLQILGGLIAFFSVSLVAQGLGAAL